MIFLRRFSKINPNKKNNLVFSIGLSDDWPAKQADRIVGVAIAEGAEET